MVAGLKTGGRKLGTPNKRTAAAAAGGGSRDSSGLSPSIKKAAPAFPRYRIAKLASLVPYANNARTHTPAQIRKIASSIREFGFTNPVLLDGKRGILAGHGRVLAAELLAMTSVPVIELSHLSATQRRALVIADNKLALDAGWDDELLTLELGGLRDGGFDLALSGFDAHELELLLDDPERTESAPRAGSTTRVETTCPKCGHEFAV